MIDSKCRGCGGTSDRFGILTHESTCLAIVRPKPDTSTPVTENKHSVTESPKRIVDVTGTQELRFSNVAPQDEEWTAHVKMLNEYTTPDRYLRHIIMYARSGEHYPTNMHVDLIEQLINTRIEAVLDSVGEPKLGDFDIKPESYDDVIKGIHWYKSRLTALRKEVSATKDEGES